jgi:hypothetical protein
MYPRNGDVQMTKLIPIFFSTFTTKTNEISSHKLGCLEMLCILQIKLNNNDSNCTDTKNLKHQGPSLCEGVKKDFTCFSHSDQNETNIESPVFKIEIPTLGMCQWHFSTGIGKNRCSSHAHHSYTTIKFTCWESCDCIIICKQFLCAHIFRL